MKENKMLYAGTFDPITNGHLDVITRGARLCDTLVVSVLDNKSKNPMFSVSERKKMIELATEHMDNIVIDSFEGLLADYVLQNDINIIIRGLRATMDFEYEIQMAQMNARLYDEAAETIFLMTSPSHSFISSSIVKEVFSFGGKVKDLVPAKVLDYMNEKYKK